MKSSGSSPRVVNIYERERISQIQSARVTTRTRNRFGRRQSKERVSIPLPQNIRNNNHHHLSEQASTLSNDEKQTSDINIDDNANMNISDPKNVYEQPDVPDESRSERSEALASGVASATSGADALSNLEDLIASVDENSNVSNQR